MQFGKPQKLEHGRFAIALTEEVAVEAQGYLSSEGFYISKATQDELERIQTLCCSELAKCSARWFTRPLDIKAVTQRFQPITKPWTTTPETLPGWAYELYPSVFTGYTLTHQVADEVSAKFVLTNVIISPTLFSTEWSVSDVKSLIERIDILTEDDGMIEPLIEIEDGLVDNSTEGLVTVACGDICDVGDSRDNSLQLAEAGLASEEETRVVRLKRSEHVDPERQQAKERLRRAKIQALLKKLQAEEEEDEYLDRYPDTEGDESESDGSVTSPVNVVIRKMGN